MELTVRTTLRHLIMSLLFFLPLDRQVRIERWLRGHEDHRKLGKADCVIVSFGKSGRTWLRVMLSRVYQVRYGLSQRHLIAFDNLHNRNPAIPRIMFTHDNYLKDYTEDAGSKSPYYAKKVVLLVRHPADVVVSQYFQWKFRMTKRKKRINNYPLGGAEPSLFEFTMMPECGLIKIIDFMNGWANEIANFPSLLVVRYEDMRADPGRTLREVLAFIDTPMGDDVIREAVAFGSVENMRRLEERRVFWLSGRRMLAPDRSNPNSYKVRRAQAGGYRNDFTPEQLSEIDRIVADRLAPVFGYGLPAATDDRASA